MSEFQLTPAQQAAVDNEGGAILVSAAAGSGKTRVLVERLMRRICDEKDPHDIDEFLVITFTKKAAAELRTRIAKELTERLAKQPSAAHLQRQLHRVYLAKIMTVDAFCGELLHEYAYQLRLPPDFRVAEEAELKPIKQEIAAQLLEECCEKLDTDPAIRALIDTLGAGRSDYSLIGLLQDIYRESRCHLSEEEWLQFCTDSLNTDCFADASEMPWGRYTVKLLHEAVGDCSFEFRRLAGVAAEDPDLGAAYQSMFLGDADALAPYLYADTWEGIRALGKPPYPRKPSVKKGEESPADERIDKARKACKTKFNAAFSPFAQSSAEVLDAIAQTADALRGLFALVPEFAKRFSAEKERLHLQDFADLEHGALRLLLQKGTRLPSVIAKEISTRFTEIMVDEYQDTNEIQDAIYKAISKDGKNRFMVGDIKQSIYRFRLADPGIFLKKYKTYRDHSEVDGDAPRRILLSENFRAGREILEAANAVFSNCMSEAVGDLNYGPDEALVCGTDHTPLPYTPVELHCISTQSDTDEDTPDKEEAEAAFVAARIRRLLDEQTPVRCKEGLRPCTPGDIAILLRAIPDRVGQTFLQALAAQGIPAVCERGSSILDSEELECMICLLQILDNAHLDIPLTSVMLSPVFAFTADDLARIRADDRHTDLYDALCASKMPRASEFLQTLRTLRTAAAELPLHALLEQIDRLTDFDSVYAAMPDGAVREENLCSFRELAAAFEDGGKRSLHQFITYLDTLKNDGLSGNDSEAQDAVNIMTIHKSKGLEFPIVVLSRLSKQFNADDSKQPVMIQSELGAACSRLNKTYRLRYASPAKKAISKKQREDDKSEEMRVLYVAMTRAQDCLIMTYCGAKLQQKLTKLSEQLTLPPHPMLAKTAVCPGDWILMTALLRTEAGELFRFAAQPAESKVSDMPWLIRVHQAKSGETAAPAETEAAPSSAAAPDLRMLGFRYAAPLAAALPGKVTATQLKGRMLDGEVDDGTVAAPVRFRQPPLFLENQPLSPTERGVAAHLAMQYLDFTKADSEQSIKAELHRMVRDRFLTQAQADAVAAATLLRVFEGPLGAMIRNADQVIREFKFSLLVDAAHYFRAEPGEQLMLQGVTDCCLVKDGALTVIDFKTDRIREGSEEASAAHYRPQLEAYSLALSRIFNMPVTKRILYYFQTGTSVEV